MSKFCNLLKNISSQIYDVGDVQTHSYCLARLQRSLCRSKQVSNWASGKKRFKGIYNTKSKHLINNKGNVQENSGRWWVGTESGAPVNDQGLEWESGVNNSSVVILVRKWIEQEKEEFGDRAGIGQRQNGVHEWIWPNMVMLVYWTKEG